MMRLDRALNEQPAAEEWRTYGSVIDSLVWVPNGVTALLDALACGEIKARLLNPPTFPPRTGNALLDAADPSSRDFWRKFKDAQLGHPAAEIAWTGWLRTRVEVQWDPSSAIYKNVGQRPTWNDIQALAWFASHDGWLVAKMANVATGDHGARQELLRYLGSYVSIRYCRCGAAGPRSCRCLATACEKLVESLRTKDLRAALVVQGGSLRSVSLEELRRTPLDLAGGTFELVELSGELRFDEAQVRAAAEPQVTADRWTRGSTELRQPPHVPPKRRGRREIEDSEYIAKMHQWIGENPGKSVRDAAKWVLPDANKDRARQNESALRRLTRKYCLEHQR